LAGGLEYSIGTGEGPIEPDLQAPEELAELAPFRLREARVSKHPPGAVVFRDSRAGGRLEMEETKKMTRAEAGRKGGRTTKERYGEEHFGRIGKIGGKKGGETTKERYGSEFYQKIGRLGGSK
jgi:general stress protein YciG